MFRTDEIITANDFVRSFAKITRSLSGDPGALLVTRRVGDHFVFLNASLYEDTLDQQLRAAQKRELADVYLNRAKES